MSIESARSFMERVKGDAELRRRLEAKPGSEQLAMATALGYQFTREELKQAASLLKDEQLDTIAGGAGSSDADACPGLDLGITDCVVNG
jgi:predicted ribosomally synthesized peptide with nif11-like leader